MAGFSDATVSVVVHFDTAAKGVAKGLPGDTGKGRSAASSFGAEVPAGESTGFTARLEGAPAEALSGGGGAAGAAEGLAAGAAAAAAVCPSFRASAAAGFSMRVVGASIASMMRAIGSGTD